MERVIRIWEIELQAVLEINKLGHRKRILYSVAGQKNILPPAIEEIKDLVSEIIFHLLELFLNTPIRTTTTKRNTTFLTER